MMANEKDWQNDNFQWNAIIKHKCKHKSAHILLLYSFVAYN